MSATHPFWVSVFLDLAGEHWERGAAFWAQVTGTDLSALRGESQQFASLLPPDGDDHVRLQRRDEGASRVHLDLHVEDPESAATAAEGLGARVMWREHGYVVLTSPGGLTFCFVDHPASRRAEPATWADGHRSALDQVCLDVPPSRWEEETAFWSALTGWERTGSRMPQFDALRRPGGQPLRFLLQRLDEELPDHEVTAHVDLATSDRAAETERHEALGARVLDRHDWWTVLRGPAGTTYCITDRDPETGMPPAPTTT